MKSYDLDKFGNCIYCHRQLVMNKVVGGQVETVLHPDASDSFFRLNTGSILVVPICKPCKSTVNLEDPDVHKKILEEVNHGWELEIHHMRSNKHKFPEFNEKKESDVRSLYSGLSIVSHEPHHKVGNV